VDDLAIVALLKRGDSRALAVIAQRYRASLVAAARSILRDPGEAEDVAQDVLMRLALGCDTTVATALQPYLESAARRLAIDRLRRRAIGERASRSAARPERAEGGDDAARSDERARLVRDLKTLGDPYRAALTLRYLEGRDFGDIAARLGTNERTARTWVGRGLALIRRRTEDWR
jgi:RNA polymerase sigma-70 factor (ECF subfamily)